MEHKFTKFTWHTEVSYYSEEKKMGIRKFIEFVDWNALGRIASEIRNVPCSVGEQYGMGGRNVVREIVFDDDVHWIGRVRFLRVKEDHQGTYEPDQTRWSEKRQWEMQSEVDTMSFVRENTDIPVPAVFAYHTTAQNPVKAPYMLIECIKDTCTIDMPGCRLEVPKQYVQKFTPAEAGIVVSLCLDPANQQAKLWTLKFDKIGSIYKNSTTGRYEIGPLADGLGGPYNTATEYYRAWITKHATKPGATSPFISKLNEIVESIPEQDKGPFCLHHPDFGVNNIIIDDNYNILAVIDWEQAFTAPIELAGQFPLRLRHFPPDLIPPEKNQEGVIIEPRWLEIKEERSIYLAGVKAFEAQQSVSDCSKLSTALVGRQADILYLMSRWEDEVPWLLTYEPNAVKEGMEKVMAKLRVSSQGCKR